MIELISVLLIIATALSINILFVNKFFKTSNLLLKRKKDQTIQIAILKRAVSILLKRKLELSSLDDPSITKEQITIYEHHIPESLEFNMILAHEIGHGVNEKKLLIRLLGTAEIIVLKRVLPILCVFTALSEDNLFFSISFFFLTIIYFAECIEEIMASTTGLKLLRRFFKLTEHHERQIKKFYRYAFISHLSSHIVWGSLLFLISAIKQCF